MEAVLNCATGTLAPYVPSEDAPWTKVQVQHFFRRVGFGASPEQLDTAFDFSPSELVNYTLDQAFNAPLAEAPEWAYWAHQEFLDNGISQPYLAAVEWLHSFVQRAIDNGPRERLTLFWHGHFATQYDTYGCPSYMYQYFNLLEANAFGDFKQFVSEIGLTPAMLYFLNGFENSRLSPNENYARELFELFTLGVNNGYTQQDIVEASRALTGHNGWTEHCGPIEFVAWGFDDGEKTIFGQTGPWNYEDLINILFEQRALQISEFICRKLYAYYVNPSINETIVSGMAQTFRNNNMTIGPVLRELFASEHFFAPENIAVKIKSPFDLLVSFQRETGFGDFENRLNWILRGSAQLGQELAEPPSVSGWPRDRYWINSGRLTGRWQAMEAIGNTWMDHYPDVIMGLARELTDNSNDPAVITRAMIDHFVTNGLTGDNAYENATDIFKWEVPQNYYDTGTWNLNWDSAGYQIKLLMHHIYRLPEFQLS